MPATEAIHPSLRELARRVDCAVEVTLYWHERSGSIAVSVFERNSSSYVQFAAEPERAMHAFYHPYAYAASMGVAAGNALPVS